MDLETLCIETTRARDRNGYGKVRAVRFGKVIWNAHVLAWVDDHGQLPPPDKPCVLHRCDNPPCVNPDHLFVGTRADNNRDMVAKGRQWNQKKEVCPKCGSSFSAHSGGRCCAECDRKNHLNRYHARRVSDLEYVERIRRQARDRARSRRKTDPEWRERQRLLAQYYRDKARS